MKKSLLTLACAALSVTAFAQAPAFASLMEAPAQAPATEADVIWTPPCVTDGHAYTMNLEAGMTGFTRVGLTDVNIKTSNGIKTEMIANTMGSEYYIKNPLPRTAIGSYIVGELVESGDDVYIECKLPQWINARESTNSGVCLSLGTKLVNPDGTVFYEPVGDDVENVIRYVMDEDENFVLTCSQDVALCGFYRYLDEESIGTFAGAAVYDVVYKEPGRKLTTSIPEGVEPQEWGMLYSNDDQAHAVTVGLDEANNKVYIAGFTPDFPESCVVGDIEGDKVTFQAGQYLGATDFTYEYLVFNEAKFQSTSDRGDVYNFPGEPIATITAVWDAEAKTISCPMDIAWFSNGGTDQLYYSNYYVGPMFLPNKGGAATPQDPEIVEVMNYMPEFGYGGFLFDLPLLGTDGEVLDRKNYTYIVYMDDEPYTFNPDEYPGVEVPMTEIPYDFQDGESEDFRVEGITHIVCWRTDGYSKVGVQGLYTVGGETKRSNIVSYTMVGVDSINADEAQSVEYYDLTGARVIDPAAGLYIKKVNFKSGKTLTTKVVVR